MSDFRDDYRDNYRDRRYAEDRDRRRGLRTGLLSLLLIPLLALGAYFAWNAIRDNQDTAATDSRAISPVAQSEVTPTPDDKVQVGVGGGVRPTVTSVHTGTTTPSSTQNQSTTERIETESTIEEGIGASSGPETTMPDSAPHTGLGGGN